MACRMAPPLPRVLRRRRRLGIRPGRVCGFRRVAPGRPTLVALVVRIFWGQVLVAVAGRGCGCGCA